MSDKAQIQAEVDFLSQKLASSRGKLVEIRREEHRKRNEEAARERTEHRAGLEREHGLVGHKRANRLYELAWEYGHSEGLYSVAQYYAEFADLIK